MCVKLVGAMQAIFKLSLPRYPDIATSMAFGILAKTTFMNALNSSRLGLY
jgi:hypothetical protein